MLLSCLLCSFSSRSYHEPLQAEELKTLSHKTFSPETMKKIHWVTKMYREWRNYRNSTASLQNISCDLDEIDTISKERLVFAMCRFISEVKKVDGSEFPGKTLYDIVVCVQFHLDTLGLSWKLLNNDIMKDIHFTLDNLMKQRASEGVGNDVKKAQILSDFDEEWLWNIAILEVHNPEVLLNTVLFVISKGCALRAGVEHRVLRSPPFQSQFEFLHDSSGSIFIRYSEDLGLKTNKGGLKHRKVDPKVVDIFPIPNASRCPMCLIITYLSMLPKERKCKAFYLQPHKKYSPGNWFLDKPAGANKLRDTIKEMCKTAGLPGFYTNHSLRATCATTLYQADIDEQIIQEITGHRSLAVRSYKRTNEYQRTVASNMIFCSQKS